MDEVKNQDPPDTEEYALMLTRKEMNFLFCLFTAVKKMRQAMAGPDKDSPDQVETDRKIDALNKKVIDLYLKEILTLKSVFEAFCKDDPKQVLDVRSLFGSVFGDDTPAM